MLFFFSRFSQIFFTFFTFFTHFFTHSRILHTFLSLFLHIFSLFSRFSRIFLFYLILPPPNSKPSSTQSNPYINGVHTFPPYTTPTSTPSFKTALVSLAYPLEFRSLPSLHNPKQPSMLASPRKKQLLDQIFFFQNYL